MKQATTLMAAVALLLASAIAIAEEPLQSEVSVDDGKMFLGSWLIPIDFNGNESEFLLRVTDVNGYLGAVVDSLQLSEPQAIEAITKNDDQSATFLYIMPFGETKLDVNIHATYSAGEIRGTIEEATSGFFTIEYRAPKTELTTLQGDRPNATEAKLHLGPGKKVIVTFGDLPTSGADYQAFKNLNEGDVFSFVEARATKLITDVDVAIGDALCKAGNYAAEYPGVYSLWMQRTEEDGWALVVNSEPDIWGSQRNPDKDLATVPLQPMNTDTEAPNYRIDIMEADAGNQLVISWGKERWTAPLEIEG